MNFLGKLEVKKMDNNMEEYFLCYRELHREIRDKHQHRHQCPQETGGEYKLILSVSPELI